MPMRRKEVAIGDVAEAAGVTSASGGVPQGTREVRPETG